MNRYDFIDSDPYGGLQIGEYFEKHGLTVAVVRQFKKDPSIKEYHFLNDWVELQVILDEESNSDEDPKVGKRFEIKEENLWEKWQRSSMKHLLHPSDR